jgi:hypothetical protein
MNYLPQIVPLPDGRVRGRNVMLDQIAARLRAEGDVLIRLAVELECRHSLESAAVAPLSARLSATTALLGKVATEVAAAGSLALVDKPNRASWSPIAGGLDRL